MKNKTHLIMLFIGIILVIMGVLWSLLGTNNNSGDNDKSGFTGRYKKSEIVLDIYQINDNEAYYVIDNIYGKGTINNNILLGVKDNKNYQFSIDNTSIKLETDNQELNGVYEKESTITYDEFFTYNYGSIDYLNSKYNGIFKDEYNDDEVDVYQVGENKYIALCNFIPEKEKIMIFSLNKDGFLEARHDSYYYKIYVNDKILVFTKTDMNGEIELFSQSKELTKSSKFTKESIIDFTINHDILNTLVNNS